MEPTPSSWGANVTGACCLPLRCRGSKTLILKCLCQNRSLPLCFAHAPPPSCLPLAVFEWNVGTASVTEYTSPQVLLMAQDEREAFGLDYSHSVADTPHIHHMRIDSVCWIKMERSSQDHSSLLLSLNRPYCLSIILVAVFTHPFLVRRGPLRLIKLPILPVSHTFFPPHVNYKTVYINQSSKLKTKKE